MDSSRNAVAKASADEYLNMRGCLKKGGDPLLGKRSLAIIGDIPGEVVGKIIKKFNLKELKINYPLPAWPVLKCGACGQCLYSADSFEDQMCWTHIHSSLVVGNVERERDRKVFLLCQECGEKIDQVRIEYCHIYDGTG